MSTQRDELAQIKARLAAITPGPWHRPLNTRWKSSVTAQMPKGDPASSLINNTDHEGNPERATIVTAPIWSMGGFVRKQSGKDLEFIAHAPEDMGKVIAALEAVQQLAEDAMSEPSYLLPGGYPSKPVEARLLLTVIGEALA